MKASGTRMILGLASLLVASAPAWGQPYPPPPPPGPPPGASYPASAAARFGEFRLWVGGFQPDAHGDYWESKFGEFTGSRSDLRDVIGGGDFIYHFDRYNAVIFSARYDQTTFGH